MSTAQQNQVEIAITNRINDKRREMMVLEEKLSAARAYIEAMIEVRDLISKAKECPPDDQGNPKR